MGQLLFEGPNAIFYQKLIEDGHAPAFCPGYGYDYTTRQSTFTIGVQGVSHDKVYEIEKHITNTLKEAREKGFEKRLFETVLHQLEFNAKKTKNHKGLGYLSHMVPLCLHGGDPISFFKIDEYSKQVRGEFDKGNVFGDLIDKYFLSN